MEKPNYRREMDSIVSGFEGAKPRLLLQSCCGPCSTSTLETLTQYFDVTVLYYNPNIQPREEYDLRLSNQRKVLEHFGVKILECEYDGHAFTEAARGYEDAPEGGARCARCFELRLRKTAREAKKGGFDWYCTTLTVSPHKNAELINAIGRKIGEEEGIAWLPSDFKKKDGYLRSIRLSTELGLYRQDYCGCSYSMWHEEEHNG